MGGKGGGAGGETSASGVRGRRDEPSKVASAAGRWSGTVAGGAGERVWHANGRLALRLRRLDSGEGALPDTARVPDVRTELRANDGETGAPERKRAPRGANGGVASSRGPARAGTERLHGHANHPARGRARAGREASGQGLAAAAPACRQGALDEVVSRGAGMDTREGWEGAPASPCCRGGAVARLRACACDLAARGVGRGGRGAEGERGSGHHTQ